jgi:hypothetical protein
MKPTYQQLAEAQAQGIIDQRREPLEVERLVSSDARRLTVEAHAQWREAAFPAEIHHDPIDLAVADIPGPARTRSQREVSRVLSILHSLDGKDGAR